MIRKGGNPFTEKIKLKQKESVSPDDRRRHFRLDRPAAAITLICEARCRTSE
jgi:hypothetical protein